MKRTVGIRTHDPLVTKASTLFSQKLLPPSVSEYICAELKMTT